MHPRTGGKLRKVGHKLKVFFSHRLVGTFVVTALAAATGIVIGYTIYYSFIVPHFAPVKRIKRIEFNTVEREFSGFMGRYIAATLISEDQIIENIYLLQVQATHTGNEPIGISVTGSGNPHIELRFNEEAKILHIVIRARKAYKKEDYMVRVVGEEFGSEFPISNPPMPKREKLEDKTVIATRFPVKLMNPGDQFVFEILVANYEPKTIEIHGTGPGWKIQL